jgi:hypothetical protein
MSETEFVGELPPSSSPWRMCMFGDSIYLINDEHPPHVIEDGKLKVVPLHLLGFPVKLDPTLPPHMGFVKDRHGNVVGTFTL